MCTQTRPVYTANRWFGAYGDGQVEDYRRFEESLKEDNGNNRNDQNDGNENNDDIDNQDIRVGIKDW